MKNDIKNVIVERLKTLSDTQLLDALRSAVQAERQSTAALVAHIAEVDARRLYLERAKPSMFSYCVDVLKLSEQAAYLRIYAARLTRRFPEALDGLATGRLHLTALKLVGPHLTEENSEAVLERVSGKSRRATEQELARLFPREDAPSQLRKLPARRGHDCAVRKVQPGAELSGAELSRPELSSHAPSTIEPVSFSVVTPRERTRSESSRSESLPAFEPHRRSDVSRCTALSESRYRLQVTLPEQTRVKLDAARDLLRQQVPDGDLASVLDHALDALIEARMKRKFAKTSRPRREASASNPSRSKPNATQAPTTEPSDSARSAAESRSAFGPSISPATSSASRCGDSKSRSGSSIPRTGDSKQPSAEHTSDPRPRPRSRHIPNAVKRAVVERDGMRCSFVDEEGCRCTATSQLEFHHHDPFAKGGAHSVSNVSLLCRAHNGHAACRDYGPMMERYGRPPDGVRERRAHYGVAS